MEYEQPILNAEELKLKVDMCFEEHKKVFEKWEHGDIVEYHQDNEGRIIIKYQSGAWWHYRVTRSNEVIWW